MKKLLLITILSIFSLLSTGCKLIDDGKVRVKTIISLENFLDADGNKISVKNAKIDNKILISDTENYLELEERAYQITWESMTEFKVEDDKGNITYETETVDKVETIELEDNGYTVYLRIKGEELLK